MAEYQPKTYRTDGGDTMVIAAGGKVRVEQADGIDAGKYMKVAVGDLAKGNADAYAFAWQNPEAAKILVHRLLVDVTTAGGTGSSVLDAGRAATATTESDDLIDGANLNAVALYDNISDGGTNGESRAKLDEKGGSNDHITGRIKTANAAALAGKYYIYYTVVS